MKPFNPSETPSKTTAEVLGISTRQLNNLYKSGELKQSKKGKYNLVQTVQAYIKYVSTGKVASNITEAKKALYEEQKRKLLLENNISEGNSYPASDVHTVFNEIMVIISSNEDSIPGRLASELSGITDPAVIRSRLLDELRRGRASAADRFALLGAVQESSGNAKATTTKNSRSVGKSKKSATTRKRRTRSVAK